MDAALLPLPRHLPPLPLPSGLDRVQIAQASGKCWWEGDTPVSVGLGSKPVLGPLWLEEWEVWEGAMLTWVVIEVEEGWLMKTRSQAKLLVKMFISPTEKNHLPLWFGVLSERGCMKLRSHLRGKRRSPLLNPLV